MAARCRARGDPAAAVSRSAALASAGEPALRGAGSSGGAADCAAGCDVDVGAAARGAAPPQQAAGTSAARRSFVLPTLRRVARAAVEEGASVAGGDGRKKDDPSPGGTTAAAAAAAAVSDSSFPLAASSSSPVVAAVTAAEAAEAAARAASAAESVGPLDRVLAASVGGALSAIVVTPLDVVKARLQAQQAAPLVSAAAATTTTATTTAGAMGGGGGGSAAFRGSADAMLRIGRTEGALSLWRGVSPTLVMAIPAAALYFSLYEQLKLAVRAGVSLSCQGDPQVAAQRALVLSPLLAGLGARVVTSTVTSPLEMARTYMQSSSNRGGDSLQALRAAVRTKGAGVLWRGLVPTLLRDAPFSGLYWSLYEVTKYRLVQPALAPEPSPFLTAFLSGASAGMVAAWVTTPLDVVKTQMQMRLDNSSGTAETSALHRQRSSTHGILRDTYARYGVRGLFAGAVPRTVRAAPSCAIMISSFELCMRLLRERR